MKESRCANGHAWQSSMNIAILTCIAITWLCIGMCVWPKDMKDSRFTNVQDMKDRRFTNPHAWPWKKTGRGGRGEGAAPPPQSSMSIAILTCIAIAWICIRMCVTKKTWRVVDLQMHMLGLRKKKREGWGSGGGRSASPPKQHEHSYSHMYCYHVNLYRYVSEQKDMKESRFYKCACLA